LQYFGGLCGVSLKIPFHRIIEIIITSFLYWGDVWSGDGVICQNSCWAFKIS